LNSLECDHPEVSSGNGLPITVVLNNPAPPSGSTVYLVSGDPKKLSVPAFVEVPAGNIQVVFNAQAAADIKRSTVVDVTAKTVGKAQVLRITLKP
jgi:hypothetical protein